MTEPTTPTRPASESSPAPANGYAAMKARPLKYWTPRHERFALAMARGMTLAAASRYAGLSGEKANACVLAHRPDMRARIAELQAKITAEKPQRAARASVMKTKGAAISLRLHSAAAVIATLQLEPAAAIALANDLFEAARPRRPRPPAP